MKVTQALRTAIRRAACGCVQGTRPRFEVGMREGAPGDTFNMRLWHPESDLIDCIPLNQASTYLFQEDTRGEVLIDLYAYTGTGYERELETNVYVLIGAEGVLSATSNESELSALLRRN
jgi:hypothetical protein